VTGVQTCALPIFRRVAAGDRGPVVAAAELDHGGLRRVELCVHEVEVPDRVEHELEVGPLAGGEDDGLRRARAAVGPRDEGVGGRRRGRRRAGGYEEGERDQRAGDERYEASYGTSLGSELRAEAPN